MTDTVERLNYQFIDSQWEYVVEFLERGLLCSEGELDISQLRLLCAIGRADIFVTIENGDIIGALAVEAIVYPNFRAANIISAGGSGIYNERFWQLFRVWLKDLGYSKVQGYCPPAVSRLLKRIDGFKTPYEIVRADIL